MMVAVRLVSVTEVKCTGYTLDGTRVVSIESLLLSSLSLFAENSWCTEPNLL